MRPCKAALDMTAAIGQILYGYNDFFISGPLQLLDSFASLYFSAYARIDVMGQFTAFSLDQFVDKNNFQVKVVILEFCPNPHFDTV